MKILSLSEATAADTAIEENSFRAMSYPLSGSALSWLETIFVERFGHAWHLSRSEQGLCLQLEGAEGAIVFDLLQDCFTLAHSNLPSAQWDAKSEGWHSVLGGPLPAPGVSRLPEPLIEPRGMRHFIHYDIPGLTYWMLARVEEIGRTDLDNHARFPATSSHAFNSGYLDRPIIDEWLYVLGQIIKRQWPGVELRRHRFQMLVSHDVDQPTRYGFASPKNLVRRMIGDLVRGNFSSALMGPSVRLNTRSHLHPADPFNTFDWIMNQSERSGITSAFYFICRYADTKMSGEYKIKHPAVRELLRRIHARGHEIGLHPSYNTYKDYEALKREADLLREVCAEEDIHQTEWGGRMHYLRWEQPTTLRAWAYAGMDYESTMSYADHAGFRCGTCFEYPGFDAVGSEPLAVRVRPLIAMETSILSEKYMGCEKDEALLLFKELKNKCQKFNGQFTLLWHNSELINKKKNKYLLKSLLECL